MVNLSGGLLHGVFYEPRRLLKNIPGKVIRKASSVVVFGSTLADVILCASARFGSKTTGRRNEALPAFAVEFGNILGHDFLPYQGTGKTGVEAVSGTDRADYIRHWRSLKLVAAVGRTDGDVFRPGCADEVGAMLTDIPIIYIARVASGIENFEIVGAASHNSALAEVLNDGRHEAVQLVGMVLAEVEIVVNNDLRLPCLLEELCDEGTHPIANGKVRTIDKHIAMLQTGQRPAGNHTRRLLVKQVVGIAIVGKKGQADGTLLALSQQEMFRLHTIVPQEVCRLLPHAVASRVTHKGTRHTGTSHTDDTVEGAATGHCCHRLPLAKENVQNGLPRTDYFSVVFHFMLRLLCKDSEYMRAEQTASCFSHLFCFNLYGFAPFV